MANRLKRFWDIPTLWPICFSILFGVDVADIDFDRDFDAEELFSMFGKRRIVQPETLIVITSLLQHGLKEVMRHQDDPDSPAKMDPSMAATNAALRPDIDYRVLSMDLDRALESRRRRLCSVIEVAC